VKTINFGAKDGVQAVTITYPIDFLPATWSLRRKWNGRDCQESFTEAEIWLVDPLTLEEILIKAKPSKDGDAKSPV